MLLVTIEFSEPINSSLQIGDFVYYSVISTAPNSNIQKTTTSQTQKLGVVDGITSTVGQYKVIVLYDSGVVAPPVNGITYYYSFEKDKRVNSSSIIGYYADVKLTNNSKGKIELFSLGSEVTESSK